MTTLAELNALGQKAMGNVIVICRAGREDAEALVETYHLNVPVVADTENRLGNLFGISSVPTAVLINARNQIQSVGHPLREDLEQVFDKPTDANVPATVQGAN
jgi:hypothetical protein